MKTDEVSDKLRTLIVTELGLDDVSPADIDEQEPLFGEGLGLDSLDALQLAMAIEEQFGVVIEAESETTRAIFGSVAALADHIASELDGLSEKRLGSVEPKG